MQGTGSSMAGLYTDENLTALDLYNLMLIPSGNDAAYVLADYVKEKFNLPFVMYYAGDGTVISTPEKDLPFMKKHFQSLILHAPSIPPFPRQDSGVLWLLLISV